MYDTKNKYNNFLRFCQCRNRKSFPANYNALKNYKPTLEKKRLFDYNVILK